MSANHLARARLKHHIEYGVALLIAWCLRILPRRTRLAIGRLVGSLVFAVDKRHQAITLANVDQAFGSEKTSEEKRAIARGAYRHFGAMFFELLTIGKPSARRIERTVEFEGLDNYHRANAAGKGVILVAAHFGNWEIHAIAHGYRAAPMAVVARIQDNPHFNRWLEDIRTVSGNTVLYKQRALARMMRLLKDGGTVAVLIDQNVTQEDGVFVEYFGRLAATTPVVSWLAYRTGAALVPVFTLPLADGRYRLIYEKPIDLSLYAGPDRHEVAQNLTQHCARILEGYVRRNPEYWLWMHRRWKTRPPGEEMQRGELQSREAS
jgi:KDO2-lipid IV(A) lauroyltransferase